MAIYLNSFIHVGWKCTIPSQKITTIQGYIIEEEGGFVAKLQIMGYSSLQYACACLATFILQCVLVVVFDW